MKKIWLLISLLLCGSHALATVKIKIKNNRSKIKHKFTLLITKPSIFPEIVSFELGPQQEMELGANCISNATVQYGPNYSQSIVIMEKNICSGTVEISIGESTLRTAADNPKPQTWHVSESK